MKKYPLGRLPRKFDKRIRKLKTLAKGLPAPPATVDWTRGQTQFGMMMNDQLGCCTCAALFHARQIWTLNASNESTQPDADVLKLYEGACGYDPSNPDSDQGGVEQNVLQYAMNSGLPLADGTTDKLSAYVEVNPKKLQEVRLTVAEFGVAYIGIQMPDNVWGPDGEPLAVWDAAPGAEIDGGHAVIIVGYDQTGFTVISWGSLYKMTLAFFSMYCDEVYALAGRDWINAAGRTPLGLTLEQLEALMADLKG